MRYYNIVISNPTSGAVVKSYTSFANGKTIPGALDIEIDIPVVPFAVPAGAGFIHIKGVSLQDIGQASDLNGSAISVYGGMQAGLPLANPAQAGLLAQGFVFQAFGNRIGTDQSLDLVIQAGIGTTVTPKNIILNWKKGTTLATAMASTLSTAFPSYQQNINLNSNLVLPADETGYFQTLAQFAAYVKSVSANIVGGTYQGVDIIITETTVSAYDGSTPANPTQINFTDMIGQPTWIDPLTVQVKLVMRADLVLGDSIQFPQTQVTQTAAGAAPAGSSLNQKSAFQGVFQIGQMRHVGSFRQPDAASWVTVIDAFSAQATT